MSHKKSFLIILDGWGIGKNPEVDAIQNGQTPFFDQLIQTEPNTTLVTYGEEVGLPEGQMGNSEVGHLNIGAGRVVYQELARINKACKDDSLARNPVIQNLVHYAKSNQKPIHLLGLLSDGGVHSHINHLKKTIEILEAGNIHEIYVHVFLDGRDTDPHGGLDYVTDLQAFLKGKRTKIASIIGRYYAMDRDNRYERIKISYDALVRGKGEKFEDPIEAIRASYDKGITDEFVEPIIIQENGTDVTYLKDEDAVFFYNFRTDRPRQLTKALSQEDMPEYGMQRLNLHYVTMTQYDQSFNNVHVVFTKDTIKNTMGQVISDAGLTQLRIAETEKYPHVTFFFSGGEEKEFSGESRILIPSPKVATYDLQPEMSADEVTSAVIESMKSDTPDFICLNFANTDMVGHTGDFDAAIKAAETVDACLKEITEVALDKDYEIIIIADHGNSDKMKNEDGSPNTAHTTNLVPIIYLSNTKGKSIEAGKLADVAPTLLSLMGIEIPDDMTGEILIR